MGIFGGGYEKAGSGIAKNAPKKKGIARYLEILGQKFWKLLELNFLYFLAFLPLIGAIAFCFLWMGGKLSGGLGFGLTALFAVIFALVVGPATAAHTKILKNFYMEKPTFLVHDYFQTFRGEFKHACVVGLLDCLITCSIAAACYVYPKLIDQSGSNAYYILFAITLSVGLIALLMNFYIFLMLISTNLSLKNALKNALALAVVALKKNALTLLIVVAVVAVYLLLLFFVPLKYSVILLFLLPFLPASWVGLAVVQRCYPVIQKYIINPYYEQRGEVNPELINSQPKGEADEGDVVFEDMGGREKPIEPVKKAKSGKSSGKSAARGHKGKIIS